MTEERSVRVVNLSVWPSQGQVLKSSKRFRVLVAGRRFGKTHLALIELFRSVCARHKIAWYVAPTYKQAKRIAWTRLKELTKRCHGRRVYETDLRIEFSWGAAIALRGADHYDSLRGEGLDFVVLDEYASMSPQAWTEVLRPSLTDRNGRALFIGTPKGYNHFYELYDAAHSNNTDWAAFHFTTEQGGNVSQSELAAAAREMDERTYRQEFQASFENLGNGRVYYAFSREHNVGEVSFDKNYPLFWSLDFNVNPMCSVIGQVVNGRVFVLDEIVLANAHTAAACDAFLDRMKTLSLPATIPLHIYGDATGDSRHSSASKTDWQIVKDAIRSVGKTFEVTYRARRANPTVKDRINCVNAMLRNQAGDHRLFIHPGCRQLIRDFEQVAWKTDANGNWVGDLDKSDAMRTHASDALGYMIEKEFPIIAGGRARSEVLL